LLDIASLKKGLWRTGVGHLQYVGASQPQNKAAMFVQSEVSDTFSVNP